MTQDTDPTLAGIDLLDLSRADAAHVHRAVLAALVDGLFGDTSVEAYEARESHSFLLNELRIRLDHDDTALSLRCRVPSLHATEAVLRGLLEHDIACPNDPVAFGMDPATGEIEGVLRLEAAFAEGAEDSIGAEMLEVLLDRVQQRVMA